MNIQLTRKIASIVIALGVSGAVGVAQASATEYVSTLPNADQVEISRAHVAGSSSYDLAAKVDSKSSLQVQDGSTVSLSVAGQSDGALQLATNAYSGRPTTVEFYQDAISDINPAGVRLQGFTGNQGVGTETDPEPATHVMILAGLGLMALIVRRRSRTGID